MDDVVNVETPEPWQMRAECDPAKCGYPPDVFFPGQGVPSPRIRAVCLRCPVQQECLASASELQVHHGMWAGMMGQTLQRAIRAHRKLSVAVGVTG